MSLPTVRAATLPRAEVSITVPNQPCTSVSVVGRPPVVSVGIPGPQGPPGSSAGVVIHQTAPSASWVIPHSLGRFPLVQVFSNEGEIVFPDVIAGLDTVSVIFAQPTTGSLVII